MSGTEVGLILGQVATFLGLIVTIIIAVYNKKARSPSDDNESIRLGNEFLRGLLKDAKDEREELRKTIDELRQEKAAHASTIERLEDLLNSKNTRIDALEKVLDHLTEKLQAGKPITLEDILSAPITGSVKQA